MNRFFAFILFLIALIGALFIPSSPSAAQGSYYLLPVPSFNDHYIYTSPAVSVDFNVNNVSYSGDCIGSAFTWCGASLSLYRDVTMDIYGVVADFTQYERDDSPFPGWLVVGTSSEFNPVHYGVIGLTTEQVVSTPLLSYRWCATDITLSSIGHLDCDNVTTSWADAANGNAPEVQERNSLYVGTRRASNDFSFDMSLNLYWLIVDCPGGTSPDPYGVCTPDPTATPTVTPTIVPGNGYDLDCVVSTSGIPGTSPGDIISANLLDNGSFEAVGFQPGNSSQPASWYGPDDWELDGLVLPWVLYDSGVGCGSDVVCSPDGIMSLRSSHHLSGFPDDYRYGRLCQDVYLIPGSYNLRFGYDYQEVLNDVPDPLYWSHWHVDVQAGVFVWNRLLRDPSLPNPPRWSTHIYTSTNTVSGGGFQFCMSGDYYGSSTAHIPTIDKIYLHALDSSTGEVFCQGPLDPGDIATPTPTSTNTPVNTPIPTMTPLGTLALPTYGPLPTIDPGVGLTPRATSCYGVSEESVPELVLDGYYAVTSQELPTFGLCFAPNDIAFDPAHPIRAVVQPETMLGVLTPIIGMMLLAWVRKR